MPTTLNSFRAIVDIKASLTRVRGAAGRQRTTMGDGGLSAIISLAHGTGNNQVNMYFENTEGMIAAGANADLDLAGGLTDEFGTIITFTTVKVVAVFNTSALAATKITVGNTGSTWLAAPWVATISKGAPFLWADILSGRAVTAGTGDVLRLTNADGVNAAAYEIFIAGCV